MHSNILPYSNSVHSSAKTFLNLAPDYADSALSFYSSPLSPPPLRLPLLNCRHIYIQWHVIRCPSSDSYFGHCISYKCIPFFFCQGQISFSLMECIHNCIVHYHLSNLQEIVLKRYPLFLSLNINSIFISTFFNNANIWEPLTFYSTIHHHRHKHHPSPRMLLDSFGLLFCNLGWHIVTFFLL